METIFVITDSVSQSFGRLGNSVSVGRSPDNDIQVLDVSVSRRHLKIKEKNKQIFINDLNSKNGTYVNGIPIEPGIDHELNVDTPIVIGTSVICMGKACLDRITPFADSLKILTKKKESAGETSFTRSLNNIKDTRLIKNVNSILDASSNLNELKEKLLHLIMEHFLRVDRGIIVYYAENEDRQLKETIVERSKPEEGFANKKYGRKIVDLVLRSKKPIVVIDSSKEKDPVIAGSLKLLKIGSVMCTPLIKHGRIMGALYIDSYNKPYGFRENDLPLFVELGDLTANAIETYLTPENDR